MTPKAKTVLSYLFLLVLLPAIAVGGYFLFRERGYVWISVVIAAVACIPFFIRFEKTTGDVRRTVLLALMIALSVLGRLVFSYIPHFKPVTAIIILAGIYLGAEAGFLCGSLSVLCSNFIFGQGPWTPFQMVAWGMIGFIAGVLSNPFKRYILLLMLYGVISGIFYSLFMDILTVLWLDGGFTTKKYLAAIVTSFPVTLTYVFSNVIFLFVLVKPLGKKIDRIKEKYGI